MSYENNASQVLEITWSTPWYLQNFNTKISDASQRKELPDIHTQEVDVSEAIKCTVGP